MEGKIKYPWGIEGNSISAKSWDEVWETLIDCGDAIYLQTKRTYVNLQKGLDCAYKYVIVLGYWMDEEDKAHFYSELYLVPLPTVLHPEVAQKILKTCGLNSIEEIKLDEILLNCFCPLMAKEDPKFTLPSDEDDFDWLSNNEVQDYLIKAKESLIPINSLRGFHLDKPLNRCCNNGWDFLKGLILNADVTQLGFDRYDELMKGGVKND